MLPSAARVRRSADFAAILKRGQRARRGAVVVHVGQRESPEIGARVGFIVSKAVGIAVKRNLVKRRLRHAVASRIGDWPGDLDIVVRALPEAASASYRQLESDVDNALTAACRRRR